MSSHIRIFTKLTKKMKSHKVNVVKNCSEEWLNGFNYIDGFGFDEDNSLSLSSSADDIMREDYNYINKTSKLLHEVINSRKGAMHVLIYPKTKCIPHFYKSYINGNYVMTEDFDGCMPCYINIPKYKIYDYVFSEDFRDFVLTYLTFIESDSYKVYGVSYKENPKLKIFESTLTVFVKPTDDISGFVDDMKMLIKQELSQFGFEIDDNDKVFKQLIITNLEKKK